MNNPCCQSGLRLKWNGQEKYRWNLEDVIWWAVYQMARRIIMEKWHVHKSGTVILLKYCLSLHFVSKHFLLQVKQWQLEVCKRDFFVTRKGFVQVHVFTNWCNYHSWWNVGRGMLASKCGTTLKTGVLYFQLVISINLD